MDLEFTVVRDDEAQCKEKGWLVKVTN